MNETKELLKASFERLEGLIGEVKDLRYKVKDVSGEIDSLRSTMKEGRKGEDDQQKGDQGQQGQKEQQGQKDQQGQGGEGGDRLEQMEERLDYLAQKWMELDQEIFKLKKKQKQKE